MDDEVKRAENNLEELLKGELKVEKCTQLEELRRAMLESSLNNERPRIKPEDLIEKTGISCKIPGCEGIIVKEYCIPYIPAQFGGENMMGPGSENVATIKDKRLKSIYCNCCMVKYEKVPQ